MSALISPAELPKFVPCSRVLATSEDLGWNGVEVRSYHQAGHDVELPGVRDFFITAYRGGATPMRRCFDGSWTKATCMPGDFSLLTRAQPTHWIWTADIDVCHVYLSERLVSDVAREMMGRDVAEVHVLDMLKAVDPVVNDCVDALLREVHQHAPGGSLYAEALGTQLAVHLLRRYATASFHEPSVRGCLSPEQRRRIGEYIDDRIHESLTLQTLASVLNLGPCNFMRRFRQSFGISPHAFVVERRVERARGLLQGRAMSVKEVAFTCGFADQSHMTRVFRASLNTTPSALQGVLYRTTNG